MPEGFELPEGREERGDNPFLISVSVTIAILAVLVAADTLLGHRAHTEELLLQSQATDQWAYYQAKNIRRHSDEFFIDLTSVQSTTDAAGLAKLRDKYLAEAARYKDEQKDIEDKAREMEAEVAIEMKRADRFDLAEVFLEIGLVITSITLLSGRRLFWTIGVVLGVLGTAIAITGFLIH